MTIKQNIQYILRSINQTTTRPIKLIVVSKNQSVANIEQAITAGINDFAENYVQEAMVKWVELKAKYPQVKLHLIGHLQSNKVQPALKLFDVIQSLDSIKLIESIASKLQVQQKQSFFIQVNLDKHKDFGVAVNQLPHLINKAVELKLPLQGLMGILPYDVLNPEVYFKQLAVLNQQYNFSELSMGMSKDYLQAIACGATTIRLGRIVFQAGING